MFRLFFFIKGVDRSADIVYTEEGRTKDYIYRGSAAAGSWEMRYLSRRDTSTGEIPQQMRYLYK